MFQANRINEVTYALLDKLVDKIDNLAVVFYDMEEDPSVESLQSIADECVDASVGIVKVHAVDADETRRRYGLTAGEMPAVLFFEAKIPSLYDGDVDEPAQVLEWILRRKTDTSIYKVFIVVASDCGTGKFQRNLI